MDNAEPIYAIVYLDGLRPKTFYNWAEFKAAVDMALARQTPHTIFHLKQRAGRDIWHPVETRYCDPRRRQVSTNRPSSAPSP